MWELPQWLSSKEFTCSAGDAGDTGSIPGSGKSPGDDNDYPCQHSWQEKPIDRGAWRATVHGVTKSHRRLKRLSMHTEDILKLVAKNCQVWCHISLGPLCVPETLGPPEAPLVCFLQPTATARRLFCLHWHFLLVRLGKTEISLLQMSPLSRIKILKIHMFQEKQERVCFLVQVKTEPKCLKWNKVYLGKKMKLKGTKMKKSAFPRNGLLHSCGDRGANTAVLKGSRQWVSAAASETWWPLAGQMDLGSGWCPPMEGTVQCERHRLPAKGLGSTPSWVDLGVPHTSVMSFPPPSKEGQC